IRGRKGQSQGKAQRASAHGRQITDRHRQGAVSEIGRTMLFGKVDALHQTVGGTNPLAARRGSKQGGSGPDARCHGGRATRLLQPCALEVPAYQSQFPQRHVATSAAQRPRRDALTSTLRRRGASLSRMPLTYL